MSKNSRVNSEYLYSEGDIDSYVNNVIRYGLGGFKSDEHGVEHKFLLNNKFGTENNPYYVLYSGAVDSAGKLPLDFFFDKSKQPAPEPKKRDDRKDVFDELMPVMLLEENCKAKILFPYNITNIHWLTGEIIIDKKCDNVSVVIYTHNPYGGGKLSQENFAVLNTALQKRIEESGLQVISVTAPESPFTNARQSMTDDTSCGVITADEVVRRLLDTSLNISSPYPVGAEQLRLSQLTFLQDKFGEEDRVYQHFKGQVTLRKTDIDLEDTSTLPIQEIPILTIGQTREKVQQIVSSQDTSDIDKIAQLKQIEVGHYKPFIQQLAYKKTQEELKDLVIALTDLGYLTTKLGELSGELKYYNEAAVFYQYVITILDEKLSAESKNAFIKQELVDPYQQLADIQQLIFSAIGGDKEKMPVVMEEAVSNKLLLYKLRLRADLNMEMIEKNYQQKANADNQEEKQKYQELYIKTTRELFEDTANTMQKFLAKLYSDSEKTLTIPPPCKYAVIGLGSMALQQMTPYSDLEFAILTDNEDYQQSDDPKVREYFKNLSQLVNFKVINLGESIIPISRYGLDMSHLVHRAVNFDLGGKTPLGRIDQDKKYDLVQTVDGMMGYVRNEQNWVSHIDKNLPHILEKVCYVYGDEQIVQNYQNNIMEFLSKNVDDSQNKLNCQIRALKLLEEGTVEINYNSQAFSSKSKESVFKGDLDKFQPNLDDAEGRLFDVKQEIYRLPDRMVYNLGLYYGIVGDSSWDTVDKLASKGVISVEAASNLKNAITFASTLRLKTYLHHQAQIEDMSIFAKPAENESAIKEQAKQIFHLPEDDLQEDGGLFQYFYTALPLHSRLQDFCDQYEELDETSKQQFFQKDNFYENNLGNQGLVHYRLLQYKAAQSKLEEALKTPLSQNNFLKHLSLMNMLGNAYKAQGQYDQAIEKYQESLEMMKLIYKDEPHPNIATSLNNLGSAYKAKGQYDQAIEKYQESLEMMKLIYKDEPHPDIAGSLNNLGSAYKAKGQYDQAIEKSQESLKINKLIYKDEHHPDIAASLNNLGNAYKAKGQYDQAIEKFQESLKINKLIYKDEPHPAIAGSLHNLGRAYKAKGQYDQAIEKSQESLEMRKLIYKDEPHPDIAASLDNIGNVYDAKGQYDQAIEKSQESLKIKKLIYKDEHHPAIAASLNNLGRAYKAKGQYDQAMEYHQKSLEMKKLIYKDEPHPDIVASLDNIGNVYDAKGQYDQAMEYHQKSLEMKKLIYKDEPHPDIADSLNNLGNAYYNKGQYDQAMEYHQKSLEMKKLIYKDEHHPDIAASLNNLGNAYKAKGQHDQAMEYHQKSLEMKKLIYKDEPHPDIAASLNNLGNAYADKGQYDQAIEYHQKSLEMKKLIYKDEHHPDIAASLNNLGNAYKAKGQHDQAMEYHQKSLEMKKLIYKDEPHPDIAASLNNLGNAYADKGQYDQAIEYHQKSLEMRKLIYKDEPHPDIAMSLNNLGNAYADKGQYDQAIEYHQKSLEMRKLIYKDEPHPDIAMSLNNLGLAYQAKGQYDLAIKYTTQALQMVSMFHNNPYEKNIKDHLRELIGQFNLNFQKIIDTILSFSQQGLDFTDYQLHYDIALSQNNKDISIQHIEEIIEEYKLALIFFPKEQSEEQLQMKQTICDRLAELTKEEQKNIELWLAIAENNVIEIQKLADSEVDLNYTSFMNITPLIQAITTGNVAIVSALLSGNIDINKPNNDQASPLYCSLGYLGQPVNMAIVKLLLDNGANVNQPMYDGDTPMHMAHYKGNKEAIKLLLQHEANINAQNAEDKTPLHCLLEKEAISTATKLEIIQAFLQLYDVTIKDKANKTVIDYATEHCPELLSLLGNELLTVSATSTSVNMGDIMDDINVTLLAGIDLSETSQDLPSP